MDNKEIIQQRIKDGNGETGVKLYQKAQILGKGGFAKCYRGIEMQTQKEIAIKVVQKTNLIKSRAKQKLLSQIKIHKALKHQFIVEFQTVFEDEKNVYIILQLCRCRTLGEMVKKRKTLTPAETRFYIKQLLKALEYLHSNKVIHRDLKMGNIFLNDNMDIKLGDFGLSAKLQFCDEKKRTMAGTPNYIAPQIIEGTGGHSYEVDLWSTGVICYAMLFGRPPFETSQLKMTYSKIKNCQYSFPSNSTVPNVAKQFIANILVLDPKKRMSITQMQNHPFLKGETPLKIPVSALKEIPIFYKQELTMSGQENMKQISDKILRNTQNMSLKSKSCKDIMNPLSQNCIVQSPIRYDPELKKNYQNNENIKIAKLKNQSTKAQNLVIQPSNNKNQNQYHCELFSPHVQVYVDYSTKYGMGYYLNRSLKNEDKRVYGVYFNDSTLLTFDQSKSAYFYIVNPSQKDESVQIETYAVNNYPDTIKNYSKKKLLLQKFHSHLLEQLENKKQKFPKWDSNDEQNGGKQQMIYVKQWLKTKHAMMFRLNNKIFQVNFQDNSQILLNTHKREVFFINKRGQLFEQTLSQALGQKHRETQLGRRIKYTRQILNSLKKQPKNQKQ